MKNIIALFCILFTNALFAQNSLDLSYLSSGGKLKPLQAIMDIRHYDINLDVNIEQRTIQGNTIVTLNLSKQTDTILLDLVHLLKVTKVLVNKKEVGFEQKDDKIFITSNAGFNICKQLVAIHY
jgi:aminopeptidase N